MAASGTAPAVSLTLADLECSICSSHFREPKVLHCLHTFCLKCLQELGKHQSVHTNKLTCPLCRQETPLNRNEITDLPSSFSVSALVEEVAMKKLLTQHMSKIKCQSCEENNQVVSRCMDCDHFLCQECQKAHERVAVLKSHKIYALDQLQSGQVVYKSKQRQHASKCRQHPQEDLSAYCNTCEQLACSTCSAVGHGKHSLTGLSEAFERCKQDVAQLIHAAEKNKTDWMEYRDRVQKSHKKLDGAFVDTEEKISKKANKEVAGIRDQEQKLKQEGERLYKDRIKTLEATKDTSNAQVAWAEDRLVQVNKFMAHMSFFEILNLKKNLLHNLRELTEKQPGREPHSLSFMDFDEVEGSLGTLVLEDESKTEGSVTPPRLQQKGKWELKAELKTFGAQQEEFGHVHDVAAFSNHEIIILDTDYRQLITFLFKSKPRSTVVSKRHKIKGLSNPKSISVNKDDKLFVLDDEKVSILNRKFELLHQFRTRSPTCLTVDANSLIAVLSHQDIFLHTQDGSIIHQMSISWASSAMAICDKQLICIQSSQKRLILLDFNGDVLFLRKTNQIEESPWMKPTGVCFDSDRSFYITISGDSKGGIYHYTSDGRYIGCITTANFDYDAITFTPDGELVVAAKDIVHIYHRV